MRSRKHLLVLTAVAVGACHGASPGAPDRSADGTADSSLDAPRDSGGPAGSDGGLDASMGPNAGDDAGSHARSDVGPVAGPDVGPPPPAITTLANGYWTATSAVPGGTCPPPVPDDNTDDTCGLQQAIDYAHHLGIALYLPSGTYEVSDTLEMRLYQWALRTDGVRPPREFDNTTRIGNVLLGASSPHPVLHLRPTDGSFRTSVKPVLRTRASVYDATNTETSFNQSAQNYDQVIRNVDIDLSCGSACVAAAGIDDQGAEGCVIQNVRINAAGAYAGIVSLLGSGGSLTNVRVDGGRYAVAGAPSSGTTPTGADSQPAPLIAGFEARGQTQAAVLYQGRGPLTLAGFIVDGPAATAFDIRLRGTGQFTGHLALVDGQVNLTATGATVVDRHDRSLYLREVYVQGAASVTADASTTLDGSVWSRIGEYAETNVNGSPAMSLDGVLTNTMPFAAQVSAAPPSADALLARHVPRPIPEVDAASFVLPAANTGVAIQAAIDQGVTLGRPVFLPAGTYAVSQPIHVAPSTQLVGVSHYASILVPDSTFKANHPGEPVLQTVGGAGVGAPILADFKIDLPCSSPSQIYGIQWTAGPASIVRNVWVAIPITTNACAAHATRQRIRIENGGGGRWYNPLCIGQSETGASLTPEDSRCVLADGASQLAFYMLHNQGLWSDYDSEIRNSANVAVFATKSELEAHDALGVVASTNVGVFGYSGNYDGRASGGSSMARFVGGQDLVFAAYARSTAADRIPAASFYVFRDCPDAACMTPTSFVPYVGTLPDYADARPGVVLRRGTFNLAACFSN